MANNASTQNLPLRKLQKFKLTKMTGYLLVSEFVFIMLANCQCTVGRQIFWELLFNFTKKFSIQEQNLKTSNEPFTP